MKFSVAFVALISGSAALSFPPVSEAIARQNKERAVHARAERDAPNWVGTFPPVSEAIARQQAKRDVNAEAPKKREPPNWVGTFPPVSEAIARQQAKAKREAPVVEAAPKKKRSAPNWQAKAKREVPVVQVPKKREAPNWVGTFPPVSEAIARQQAKAKRDVPVVQVPKKREAPNWVGTFPPVSEAIARQHSKRQGSNTVTDDLLFVVDLPTFTARRNANDPADLIWDSDGCTSSPDNPLGFPFIPACNRHDFGYHNYRAQSRFTETNKQAIDDNFRDDLYFICGTERFSSICFGLADVYHAFVRAFGGDDATPGRRDEHAQHEYDLAVLRYERLVADAREAHQIE
ncbi:prokaryotic phospholipase A2-domain-containing protein [Stachybotrys elegans]|uniref:Prokaryotic phospholipase A2-domain-containing protein n=1 Tax=Stachybotrys elegans TaxID=80388 RepID=A0A8K0SK48_9HYPO|nr:prokaryotic phospholipase A2-domain-containing protein [Stachybotrys elegans]